MHRSSSLYLLVALSACGGGSTDTTTPDLGGDAAGTTDLGGARDAASGSDGAALDAAVRPDLGGCTDADGDGHGAPPCGDDCDDADPSRYPGLTEVCDAAGHDDDCNASTLGPDADGDGFVATTCCNTQPGGGLQCGTDCNDTSMDISPTAPESCNNVDDDCNGVIDDGLTTSAYRPDCDGDLYGAETAMPMTLCGPPATPPACPGGRWVTVGGDCDDGNLAVYPSATEVCNHADDNCNGMVDEGLTLYNYHPDCDGDSHGSSTAPLVRDCAAPAALPGCPVGGWTIADATDCCDTDASVYAGQAAYFDHMTACGDYDYDCDGLSSERYPNCGDSTLYCTGPSCTPMPPTGGGFVSDPGCGGTAPLAVGCTSSGGPVCTPVITHGVIETCR